jgi:hypothetical protein
MQKEIIPHSPGSVLATVNPDITVVRQSTFLFPTARSVISGPEGSAYVFLRTSALGSAGEIWRCR